MEGIRKEKNWNERKRKERSGKERKGKERRTEDGLRKGPDKTS